MPPFCNICAWLQRGAQRGGVQLQALERFEGFVERMMEGSFAGLFRSPIEPAELAKRLERETEAHPTISVGKTYVPNHYEVTLHSEDFAEFEPFRNSLEHTMAEFISDLAAERGYSLVARPRVILQAGEGVPRRHIEVEGHLSDEPAAQALAAAGRDSHSPSVGIAPQAETVDLGNAAPIDPTRAMAQMPGPTQDGKATTRAV